MGGLMLCGHAYDVSISPLGGSCDLITGTEAPVLHGCNLKPDHGFEVSLTYSVFANFPIS